MINTSTPLSYYDVPDPQRVQEAYTTAMQVVHQRTEADKQRNWEDKHKKAPTYKIDTAEAPFAKDQELIGHGVNHAFDVAGKGGDPSRIVQQNEYISNTSKAHNKAIEQVTKQVENYQKDYGTAIDSTPIHKLTNKAINDDDITTRPQTLAEMSSHVADPSKGIFNSQKHIGNVFSKMKEQNLEYDNQGESGTVTSGNKTKVTGKLLIDNKSKPLMEAIGGKMVPMKDGNGNQLYQKKSASTIDEALPYADEVFSDPNVAHWTTKQVAEKQKDTIDKATNDWIYSEKNRPDGGMPSKELIEAKREMISRDLAKREVAKQMLQLDRPAVTNNPTISRDEPRQMSDGERDNKYDVHSMGEASKTYNTISHTPDGIKTDSYLSHGGVVIKNRNNKKPLLTINEQTAKNESTGKYEKLVEGSEATLDNIRGVYWANNSKGEKIKRNIPVGFKSAISYLKSLTPEQVVKENIQSEPVAYLTAKGSGGTGSLGLSPEEQAKYNSYKEKFTNYTPSSDKESENYNAQDLLDFKEYDELRSIKDQKTKTYSLPYGQVKGQLAALIGDKNASPDALMSRLNEKDKNEYFEGKKILEDKRRQYAEGQKKSGSVISVNTQADYDALPKGSKYKDSAGNIATKK